MRRWKWLDAFGGGVPFAVVITIGAAAIWLLLSEGLQPSERAQISFRHARNLLEHGRLSFNISGPPVLATEAPAFTALLTACSAIFQTSRIDQVALVLNAFFLFVIAIVSYLVTKELFNAVLPSILAAVLMTFHSALVAVSARGFEQAMLLCVMLSSFYLLSRFFTAGLLLASLTPLIAWEGIVAFLLVIAFLFLSRNRRPIYFAFLFVLPLIWILFCTHHYGSVIPQPLVARYHWRLLSYPYEELWYSWLDRVVGYLYGSASYCIVVHRLIFSGSIDDLHFSYFAYLRLLLSLAALVFWIKSERKIVLYFLFPLLYILLNPVLKTDDHSLVSCAVFGILIYFFVCTRAWHYLMVRRSVGFKNILQVSGYFLLFILFQTGSRYELNPWADPVLTAVDPRGSQWAASERQRYISYRRAAEYLKKRASLQQLVLTNEPGLFGYAYPGEIFDGSGYCTPAAIRYYPLQPSDLYDRTGWRYTKAGNVIPSSMIQEIKPDYIVVSVAAIRHVLDRDTTFRQDYSQLTQAGLVWGSWLSIYQKKTRRDSHDLLTKAP